MKNYCFGIDVGGTTVKCGLFTVDGEVLDKWEIKTRTEENGKNILPDIAETINAKIAEKNIDKEEVAGVGIGVPGPVNENGEVPFAVNLHWGYMNIEKVLAVSSSRCIPVTLAPYHILSAASNFPLSCKSKYLIGFFVRKR